MRMSHIEGPFLGIADLRIIKIGKRDERAPPDSAGHDTFAHHADYVVNIDIPQAPSLTIAHDLAGEGQQTAKRLRSGSFAATDLQPGSERPHQRIIELDSLARCPGSGTDHEGPAPTFLGIFDDVGLQLLSGLDEDLREFLHIGAFSRKSDAGAVHGDVHYLGHVLK